MPHNDADYYLEARAICLHGNVPTAIAAIHKKLQAYTHLERIQFPGSISRIAGSLKIPGLESRIQADLKDIEALYSLTAAHTMLTDTFMDRESMANWDIGHALSEVRAHFVGGLEYKGYIPWGTADNFIPDDITRVPEYLPAIEQLIAERHSALEERFEFPSHLGDAVEHATKYIGRKKFEPGKSNAASKVEEPGSRLNYGTYYLEMWSICMSRQVPAVIPVIYEKLSHYTHPDAQQLWHMFTDTIAADLGIPDQEDRILADVKDMDALSGLAYAHVTLNNLHENREKMEDWEIRDAFSYARDSFERLVHFGLIAEEQVKGLNPKEIENIPEVLPKIQSLIEEKHNAMNGRAPFPPKLQRALARAMKHIGTTHFAPWDSGAAQLIEAQHG